MLASMGGKAGKSGKASVGSNNGGWRASSSPTRGMAKSGYKDSGEMMSAFLEKGGKRATSSYRPKQTRGRVGGGLKAHLSQTANTYSKPAIRRRASASPKRSSLSLSFGKTQPLAGSLGGFYGGLEDDELEDDEDLEFVRPSTAMFRSEATALRGLLGGSSNVPSGDPRGVKRPPGANGRRTPDTMVL